MKRIVFGMLVTGALLAGVETSTAAGADGIDPQCAKVSNKRGCTCALETGGTVDGNGRWKYRNTPRWEACLSSKGWR